MRESISAEALKILVVAGAARDLRAIPAPSGHGWQLKCATVPTVNITRYVLDVNLCAYLDHWTRLIGTQIVWASTRIAWSYNCDTNFPMWGVDRFLEK